MKSAATCFLTSLSLLFFSKAFAQVNQEWAVNHSYKASVNDAVSCVDAQGYIYVAGTQDNTSKDWLLIKYSPNGTELWAEVYDGGATGDDYVHAITLDDDGNVYVTGSSAETNDDDFGVVVYDKDGHVVWSATYDAGAYETAMALAVDRSGNVFVTGKKDDTKGNIDVVTVQYDNTGSLVWNDTYDYAGDVDIPYAIKIDGSRNVDIAGYCTGSGPLKYMMALQYSSSGTLNWSFATSGGTGMDGVAYALAIDGSDDLFIAGYRQSTYKDYMILKLNSAGSGSTKIYYDGPTSNDDEASDIIFDNGYLYVTGKSKGTSSGSTTYDVATLKYNTGGSLQWTSRYNGASNGNDAGIKLIADYTGDIIVTGSSHSASNGLDILTIGYDDSGTMLWNMTYDDTAHNQDDVPAGLAADLFGNVYVSGISTTSTYDFVTVKYADSTKNADVVNDALKMLAVGLINESQNDTVKDTVYAYCDLSVDSFYHIRYDSLISKVTRAGLPLKTRMNSEIATYYSLSAGNYVDKILNTLWVHGEIAAPFIGVYKYYNYPGTAHLMDDPHLAYSYNEDDYPIGCVNCSGSSSISGGDAEGPPPTWIIMTHPLPWYFGNGPVFICNCTAHLDPVVANRCKVCPQITSVSNLTQNNGSSSMNYEIEVDLGYNRISSLNYDDGCYANVNVLNPGNLGFGTAYAQISKVAGQIYYNRAVSTTYGRLIKLPHPIVDRNYYPNSPTEKYGDILNLCAVENYFNSPDEPPGARFSLGMGGVYKITRPGINQQPVYFAFPYAKDIWFSQGPDMKVYYGNDDQSNSTCSPNNERKITQDYSTEGCEFCQYYSTFGYISTQADATKYLATTDLNFIDSYWKSRVISVGFTTGAGASVLPGNYYEFTANTTGSCTPPGGTPKVSLLLLSNGSYEFLKTFDNSLTYAEGTSLTIRVRALYGNSNYIDECRPITLVGDPNTSGTDYFSLVISQIRGDIQDYDPNNTSTIKYQIDIY